MRYVIIRDDDTNAFTPVECLEQLYRPFLDHGLPINLATIPDVATDAKMSDGRPEGFLFKKNGTREATVPIGSNRLLVEYLQNNPGYHIVQHGCHHDYLEFDRPARREVAQRLDQGTRLLIEAGFPRPETFVAPYDKLSRASLQEVARRFRVLSTGWYELRRLPYSWWPQYAVKKLRQVPHWRVGRTLLLTHPGCLLSCQRTYSTMLGALMYHFNNRQVTVLVTHWWEYFRNNEADKPFIEFLHETAHYLATHPGLKVITFSDLVNRRIRLN
ncbi:MAG TPA: DUF2334 domain-containing protein [Bacillota bacterium]|nr:DUF2334 domain-containing protein [Bacillota bacterium]